MNYKQLGILVVIEPGPEVAAVDGEWLPGTDSNFPTGWLTQVGVFRERCSTGFR